jgi:haloalkane dehalogenase
MPAVRVLDSSMFFREAGSGPPVLLLHGNPTSSHLWRHVLARADGTGHRWIAPDLIGMGRSGRPPIPYRLTDHIAYLDAFVEALGLTDPILVGHDWGVALSLEHARRHPVRAVAVMEGHLRPLPGWDAFDDGGRSLFQDLRTPGVGERMVLDENFFVDTLLPAALNRDTDLGEYRAPYPDPPSRRPLLQWAREIPIAGDPADVAALMSAAIDDLAASAVPKLLLHGDPGVLVTAATVDWCRATLPALTVVDVGGPAGHFLPEDRPYEVAGALTGWVTGLG